MRFSKPRWAALFTALVIIGFSSTSYAAGYSQKDINKFCDKHTKIIANGYTNPIVKSMPAGKYLHPSNSTLLLFRNYRYLLKLPDGYQKTAGTSYPDFLASGGIVGGCSKQQLTELLQQNNIIPTRFILTKSYR